MRDTVHQRKVIGLYKKGVLLLYNDSMNTKTTILIIVLVLLIGAGIFYASSRSADPRIPPEQAEALLMPETEPAITNYPQPARVAIPEGWTTREIEPFVGAAYPDSCTSQTTYSETVLTCPDGEWLLAPLTNTGETLEAAYEASVQNRTDAVSFEPFFAGSTAYLKATFTETSTGKQHIRYLFTLDGTNYSFSHKPLNETRFGYSDGAETEIGKNRAVFFGTLYGSTQNQR